MTEIAYASPQEAMTFARRIYRGASEDLFEQLPCGRWTFDPDDLYALAEIDDEGPGEPRQPRITMNDTTQLVDTEEFDSVEESVEETTGLDPLEFAGTVEPAKLTKAEIRKQGVAERKAARAVAKAEKLEAAEAVKREKAVAREAKRTEARTIREGRLAERNEAREARREAARQRKEVSRKRAEQIATDREQAQIRRDEAAKLRAEKSAQTLAKRNESRQNGVLRPNAGTKLDTLWSIIDSMRENGSFPTFREYKSVAMQLDYETVGSPGTITTGYYDYRVYHGIKGRITESAE